jgi:hypothetical protein
LFVFLFSSSLIKGNFPIWFLDGTQAVFTGPKTVSWGMTLVLWGDRVAESASVGVHAASLIISQALL